MTDESSRTGAVADSEVEARGSAVDLEWRSARRSAIRRHHPDVGGSAEALTAALHAVDRRYGHAAYASQSPTLVRTARGRRATRRRLWSRRLRTARARLPVPTGWTRAANRGLR